MAAADDYYDIENPAPSGNNGGGDPTTTLATPQPDVASQLWFCLSMACIIGVLFVGVPILLVRHHSHTILLVFGIIGLVIGGVLCIHLVLTFFMGNTDGVVIKEDGRRHYADDRDE